MTDLSEIKLYSEANFENVSETDDGKLYFVEDSTSSASYDSTNERITWS